MTDIIIIGILIFKGRIRRFAKMEQKDNNIITLHNEDWSCEIDVKNGARCVNLRCAKYKAFIPNIDRALKKENDE